jgi:hypothetical protein
MIPALFLIIAAVLYRITAALVLGHGGSAWFSNFAPVAAIALCGAIYFPKKYKFSVPFAALLLSDIVLDIYYGFSFSNPWVLCHYLAFALVGLLGLTISRRASLKVVIPASLAGSAIFYGVTNFFSWVFDPGYAKNFAGLIQALTVGLPQYSATPTWIFFRNSLVSDLLFTLLFVACMHWSASAARRSVVVSRPLPN